MESEKVEEDKEEGGDEKREWKKEYEEKDDGSNNNNNSMHTQSNRIDLIKKPLPTDILIDNVIPAHSRSREQVLLHLLFFPTTCIVPFQFLSNF